MRDMQRTRNSLTTGCAFLIVLVLTFICFLPDLKNGLLDWDDAGYILENENIRSISAETVRWAFTTFWCNIWVPLTWLSLSLDFAFWGLNPIGYHLTNNFLHAVNAGMFFLLTRELLIVHKTYSHSQGNEAIGNDEKSAVLCSLLAALFFALHPLRVESVVWVTERKDVLSLFFGLSALLAYIRHDRFCRSQPEPIANLFYSFAYSSYYWLAIVFFCLSLLSKPMLVTLPVVFLILDWFPLDRVRSRGVSRIIAEKIIFLVFSGIVALISMNATKPSLVSWNQSDIFSRAINASKSIANYLWLTVWPVNISPFYVHPGKIQSLTSEHVFSITLIITVTVFCIVFVKRQPFFLAIWLIFLATLLPVLGFTQVGPQAMAARYTYAPSLALSFLVAVLFSKTFLRIHGSRSPGIIAIVIAGCILLFYSAVTVRHIYFWKDDVTLWTRVIDLDPHGSGRAYFQRSHAYDMNGMPLLALTDINRALEIAVQKKYKALHEIYQVRARIQGTLGNYSGAIKDYSRALESAGLQERAMLHWSRGEAFQRMGDTTHAAEDFRKAAGK